MKVAKRHILNANDELAVKEGCYFDAKAADRVVDFIQKFCHHGEGEWAGQPFTLQKFQIDRIIHPIYGWKRADNSRRYRRIYIEMPKKQGKTTLEAALSLYHLVADGEAGAQCVCAATTRKQAGILFNSARYMVENSPELNNILEIIPYSKRIIYTATNSYLEALSADAKGHHGLNVSFACVDELHAHPKPDLFNALRKAGKARRQPMTCVLTNSGTDRNSICYYEREYAQGVMSGTIPDTSTYGLIYGADDDDDITLESTWKKANPNYGVIVKKEDFEKELVEAQNNPIAMGEFLRYSLGIWTNADVAFIPDYKWEACSEEYTEEDLHGQVVYAGLDMASKVDLTALVLVCPQDDGTCRVLPYFWAPEMIGARRDRRDKLNQANYEVWRRGGHIKFTGQDWVDYDQIAIDIAAIFANFQVRMVLGDPWNIEQVANRLMADGYTVQSISQTVSSLSEPTKELQRLVYAQRLKHNNHPVLTWMVANARANVDARLNVHLDRAKSRDKIDGVCALVDALAGLPKGTEESAASIYDTPGSLWA